MHADPNLPAEGDYPTDEFDVWPALAEDAPPEAFAVEDKRGQVHMHAKGNGRFVKPPRATVMRTLGEGEDAREIPVRLFTWAEVQKMDPDDPDGPTIFEWPDEPGVEWEVTTFAPGVTSCKPVGMTTEHRVQTRPREYREPETDVLRAWGKRNGFPTIKAKGPLPKGLRAAHRAAWEAGQAKG